jgi:hypothetical protein
MHFTTLLGLLALPAGIFALSPPAPTSTDCTGQVSTGSGNRKIAIVIDSSGSNDWNDPQGYRIAAGQAIVANLQSTDRVAVVDFDDVVAVISPLGPPASASFVGIDASGGTYIAGGVEAALAALTGDPSPVAGNSGIIVLTDGEDSYVTDLVAQIDAATAAGIRVSFGFLSPDSTTTQDPTILAAIIASGGTYANIDSAEAQANFVATLLAAGLVSNDGSGAAGGALLLPGLRISGQVDAASSPETYQYDALPNEELSFTISAITVGQTFDLKLLDKASSTELGAVSTDPTTGEGTFNYTVGATAQSLQLDVSTTSVTQGIYSLGLTSNFNRTVNVCGSNTGGNPPNGTNTPPNGTTPAHPSTPTPTKSHTPVFTGAAATVQGVLAVAVFPVLFALAL